MARDDSAHEAIDGRVAPPRSAEGWGVLWLIVCGFIVMAAVVVSILFVSNYYNYVGESLSLASLLRMVASQSYVSRPDELPLLLSPYSPFTVRLIAPIVQLLHAQALETVALAARLIMLGLYVVWFTKLDRFMQGSAFHQVERRYLVLAVLWVSLLLPSNVVAVRPDVLSFLAEFISLTLAIRAFSTIPSRARGFALAGAMAGVAVAVKLNTVGGAAGIVLFLAWERRLGSLLIFGASAVLTCSAMLAAEYAVSGSVFVEQMILGSQSAAFGGVALVRRALEVLDGVFLLNIPFILFACWGLLRIRERDRVLARILTCFISCSVAVAVFGQTRIGSASNYFLGALMAGAVPVSVGVHALYSTPGAWPPLERAMRAVLWFTWGALALKAATVPAMIVINDARHFPYAALRQWIARDHPGAIIYTPDANAAVQLRQWVLLGPWAESQLESVAGFARHIPTVRLKLAERPFTLAVTTGSACDQWKPAGLFARETAHLTHLTARYDKLCVFASHTEVGVPRAR